MSSVNHQQFSVDISVERMTEANFAEIMNVTVKHLIERAHKIDHTVDWSTFEVRPSDVLEVKSMAGGVQFINGPISIKVDTVSVL